MRVSHGGLGLRRASKTHAFAATAGNGNVGTIAVFTVTGEVLVGSISGYCSENLVSAGAGTVSLGVTSSVSLFIAVTTATDLDNGTIWVDATPDLYGVALPAACKDVVITQNILMDVLTAAISDGTVRIDVLWIPLSSDGLVA